MKYLTCANIEIPLCFVQSISWTKTAKIIQHTGGYISARGFEAAEISVKLHYDYVTASALGLDASRIYTDLINLVTDRLSQSGVFYIDSYPVYPDLEFTPTNINKTFSTDESIKSEIIELDIVFSGVKPVKVVSREKLLQLEPDVALPELILSVDDKELIIQDTYAVTSFRTNQDSINISLEIGTDTDILNRDAFLTRLLENGVIKAELPQGTTKYYVISADLVETNLNLTGGVLPKQSQMMLRKTYQNTTLKAIIIDIAKYAGVECECLTDGHIDYYKAFGTPIQCIRELQESAGFIMSWRQGNLTCVDVPSSLSSDTELQYLEMTQDAGTEKLSGCYWYDGINKHLTGNLDNTAITIHAAFRSSQNYSKRCLDYTRYAKNVISIQSDILITLDSHSVVYVRSNDEILYCMAEWIEFDWLNNTMTVELHYIGE